MSLIRPHNTGTKLSNGRIATQITVGGIRTRITQRKAESEADFWARVAATKEGETRRMPTKGMKLAYALDIWIESKETKLRPNTLRAYKWIVNDYLKKMFGTIRVDTLEPIVVDRQLTKISKPRTAKMVRDVGRAFYRYALKCGWATRNAFELADPISYSPLVRSMITDAQAEAVLTKADPRFLPIFRFMRNMGLRKMEATNLTWSEIEDGWVTLKESKTAMGKQSIPIPEICEQILLALPRKSIFVFPNEKGEPWHDRTITAMWHKACDAAKIARCPVYDLRDLFASEMAQKTDRDTLRRLMRHTDVRTTEVHYIHVERERLQRSIQPKYTSRSRKAKKA